MWDYAQGPIATLDLQPINVEKHKRSNPLVEPKTFTDVDFKTRTLRTTDTSDHQVCLDG